MTDRTRFKSLDALFAKALDLPPEERPAFLDEACGGDAALRASVERLLAADAGAGSFLARPATLPEDLDLSASPEAPPPLRLGPYLLLGELGSGGMGTVYRARRDDAEYEREVAVKILRSELERGEGVQRFLAERQILARLEHPGIARMYDGGSTADGRPFLVMELVEGERLDVYCDRHRLTVEARLDLFLQVCAAVQYAHQNLLVHRDLKPGNVLVTADGRPKLLDFGIAKRLGLEAADDLTRTGHRLLTPSYASPEQIRREPVSTASDVYSLGVVLYELLAGRSPYRVESGLPHEIESAICGQEPERASQAVLREAPEGPAPEEIAAARGTRPAALRRRLRGDLDTLLQTALRKEPSRRYGSVAELAADVERLRRHLPIAARPDSLLYRSRKLLRRRRGAVAALALAGLALAGFVLGLVEQGRRLARERDKARSALAFLVDTFRQADPFRVRGEQLTAREILDQGAGRVARQLARQPDVQAALMDAIGQAQLGLGRPEAAEPLLADSLAWRRKAAGEEPLELAATLESLAAARYELARYGEAEKLLREAVALRRKEGANHPVPLATTLNQLGMTLALLEPSAEVEALHREALALARKAEGAEGPTVAATLILMGRLERDRGKYPEAERLYRKGLAARRKVAPEGDPQLLRDQGEFAVVLLDAGKAAEAIALLRENLAAQRRHFGHVHPSLTVPLSALGLALQNQGDYAAAGEVYREALALPRAASGDADVARALLLGNLASALQAMERVDESVPLLEEALRLRRQNLGEGHPLVAQALLHLARADRIRGNLEAGWRGAREALAILEKAEGKDHPHLAYPLRELGANRMAAQDAAGAEPYLRRALEVRRAALPPEHPDLAQARVSLSLCLFRLGRNGEAEGEWRQGRAALVAAFGADAQRVQEAEVQVAKAKGGKGPAG